MPSRGISRCTNISIISSITTKYTMYKDIPIEVSSNELSRWLAQTQPQPHPQTQECNQSVTGKIISANVKPEPDAVDTDNANANNLAYNEYESFNFDFSGLSYGSNKHPELVSSKFMLVIMALTDNTDWITASSDPERYFTFFFSPLPMLGAHNYTCNGIPNFTNTELDPDFLRRQLAYRIHSKFQYFISERRAVVRLSEAVIAAEAAATLRKKREFSLNLSPSASRRQHAN